MILEKAPSPPNATNIGHILKEYNCAYCNFTCTKICNLNIQIKLKHLNTPHIVGPGSVPETKDSSS